ncbi:MAG: aldolase [Candidatus Adiutrix sp.]|jgi:ribulose-5-phosphate 4-epimerase/fuculose-1-phosphate aldolase|nr:aldolase [Candidatus Adiutrix sp.]
MDSEARDIMVEYGQFLFQRGYAVGTAGNISLKLADGDILATPTNACLGRLTAPALARVRLDGEQVSGEKMSKEIAFHLALYRARPDCGAVVHLHSTYLTALSCLENLNPEEAIKPFTPYFVMKTGRLPLIPYFRPGSPLIAEALTERLASGSACLMANHGAVALGKTLPEAVDAFEELEETAKLLFILGNNPVRYLTAGEVAELR